MSLVIRIIIYNIPNKASIYEFIQGFALSLTQRDRSRYTNSIFNLYNCISTPTYMNNIHYKFTCAVHLLCDVCNVHKLRILPLNTRERSYINICFLKTPLCIVFISSLLHFGNWWLCKTTGNVRWHHTNVFKYEEINCNMTNQTEIDLMKSFICKLDHYTDHWIRKMFT